MNTEITVTATKQGWIFFDADCPSCVRSMRAIDPILRRIRVEGLPLQTPDTTARLGVSDDALRTRIHLLTADGRTFAGADALIELVRHIRWLAPLAALLKLPVILPLLRRCYDWIAANRACAGESCGLRPKRRFIDWLPLLVLPGATLLLQNTLPGWAFMWLMAFALYAGCKWLTFRTELAAGTRFTATGAVAYLFGWVGMEPAAFVANRTRGQKPRRSEWLLASAKTFIGIALVWMGVRFVPETFPLAAGWIGMLGIILTLHFGAFHLLALAWQRAGVPVQPLMRAPLLATSLGDFWGARWNTGFHALAHQFVFRPLICHLGGRGSVLAAFLISGLVHELVITIPAQGGYGLPTIYFATQGLGLLLERSAVGKKIGLAHGLRGRAFALLVAGAPAFWLFPPAFVQQIILPMLHAIGAN